MKSCLCFVKQSWMIMTVVIVGLFSTSCGGGADKIDPEFSRYISAFTYGVISPDSDIRIELNGDIPAVEVNSEIEDSPFVFSPSVKGKAYWVNASTIKFVPDFGELKQGKKYRVTFDLGKVMDVEKRFRKFKFPVKVRGQEFSVEVDPYMPLSYSDLKWNSVSGHIALSNNVPLEVVQKMLSVSTPNGKDAPIRVAASKKDGFDFTIDSLERSSELKTTRYVLTVSGSPLGISKSESFDIDMPSITTDKFSVYSAQLTNGANTHIRLVFTDPISQSQDVTGMISAFGFDSYTYQVDKNVIRIYPDKITKDITVKIDMGLRNSDNRTLDRNYEYKFSVAADSPNVEFLSNGNILPDAKNLSIPFSAVNLWAVDLNVIKISKENALYYFQTTSLGSGSRGELRRFGRPVLKKRIRLDEDRSLDLTKKNTFSLDLAPLLSKEPGAIYLIQLKMRKEYSLYPINGVVAPIPKDASLTHFKDEIYGESELQEWDASDPYYYEEIDWNEYRWSDSDNPATNSYYIDRSKIAETLTMSSNIGIIAKMSDLSKIVVATTDIITADPLSGVKITVYNYQMQIIGEGRSSGNGMAEIGFKGGRPFILTASKDNDYGYLKMDDGYALSVSRFDVGGKSVKRGLKGYVYGERGVWRPGDTLHLTVILEDKENVLHKDHPVVMELYSPQGQLYKRSVQNGGENGFYSFTVATESTDQTGLWNAYIKVGGATFHKPLRIETVKPNRLKISLETDSIINAGNNAFSATLRSQWLHGAPAANLKYNVSLTLSRTTSPFKKYMDYVFSDPLSQFSSEEFSLADGVLNSTGVAGINRSVEIGKNAPGMLKGTILSKVFEPGGDMSFYTQPVLYSPYQTYVGIKSPETGTRYYLETDTPLDFKIVCVNSNGVKGGTKDLSYKVYKLNWSWWWSRSEENLSSYVNNTGVEPVKNGYLRVVNGEGNLSFQIDYPEWGRYLVLVKDMSGGHTTGSIVYVDWPAWKGRSNKSNPDGVAILSFSTDKDIYEVGETATVIIPKSSKGQALITLESSSGIINKEWIKTSAKEDTKYTFRITKEMSPNVYVSAILLQPYEQKDNDLPIRLYGVINVNIENKESRLAPVISMANELRPEKEFEISVSEKNKKEMTYTLAIVDEGLLDITGFRTPNAWGEFYAKEALSIRTWDMFDRVLGANFGYLGTPLTIGGDESLSAIKSPVNRFKPIVKFIGPFTIKGGETKKHKFKLPPYVGSVRVMVVAGANGAYGNAEKSVAVKNSLMTLSTLPRVLGPGEEVWLPVNLFVMKDNIRNVQVSIATKGLLQPVNGSSQSVTFSKQGDKTIYFKFKTAKKIGEEEVVIKAVGNGESSTETINIAVRNPNPILFLKDAKLLGKGAKAELKITSDDMKPDDPVQLEVSRIPNVNLSENMGYLLDYPHGCSEQVTSQVFPLLYIDKFLNLSKSEKAQYDLRIAQAIKILASRQLADGGFEYWQGDNYVTEWVTTYVGHFMTEASKRGYEVPSSLLSKWASFQSKAAKSWSGSSEYRNYYSYSMVDLQQAYRLYSLALYGAPELAPMNRLRERENLSLQARWRLAATYALCGKKDVAKELAFNLKSDVESYTFNNDTYGTPARDKAMIMETYILIGDMEKAMRLAEDLSEALNSAYLTTQTASYGLYAMAKLAEKMGQGDMAFEWSLNGVKKEPVSTDSPMFRMDITPSSAVSVSIHNKGKGSIYAKLTGRTQPIEDNSLPMQGRLKIEVKYVDKNGTPKNISSLRQGEEFEALVKVFNSPEEPFTDIVLSEIFPSGWEIMNERFIKQQERDNQSGYNYMDIRDDRVYIYFNLAAGGSKMFRVKLQAAYRGRFFLPAVSCEAMYDPKEQACSKGQWVTVGE